MDVPAVTGGRDKNTFGLATVTVNTDTLVTPVHGGITVFGNPDGKDTDPALAPEGAGYRNYGDTIKEEAKVPERNVRFGFGGRGGTHIVNITVIVTEAPGSSSLGLLLYLVELVEKKVDTEEVGCVAAKTSETGPKFLDTPMCEVPEDVTIAITVSGGLINLISYSPVTVYVVNAEPISDDPNIP